VTVPFTVEEASSIEVTQSSSTHSRTTERFSVQAWTPQITNIPNFLFVLIVQNFAVMKRDCSEINFTTDVSSLPLRYKKAKRRIINQLFT
jgi:hypothetical protein